MKYLLVAGLMIIGGAQASIIIPEPGKAISATTTPTRPQQLMAISRLCAHSQR